MRLVLSRIIPKNIINNTTPSLLTHRTGFGLKNSNSMFLSGKTVPTSLIAAASLFFFADRHKAISTSAAAAAFQHKSQQQQHSYFTSLHKSNQQIAQETLEDCSNTVDDVSLHYGTEYHAPVMVTECIDALMQCRRGEERRQSQSQDTPLLFIDATLGGGGHSQALLDRLQKGDVVFGVDVDPDALQTASLRLAKYLPTSHPLSSKDDHDNLALFIPIQSNFKDLTNVIPKVLQEYYSTTSGIIHDGHYYFVDGILMDLGVSSHQIDQSTRGFAILKDGPLDMRMYNSNSKNSDDSPSSSSSSLTAADICNEYGETELIHIFQTYADESTRAAKNIARAIIQQRPLASTSDLLKAIALVTPKFHKASRRKGISATSARIFQSLRIVVNREDEALKVALLSMTPTLIRPGGHLVVLSYHSMEDRFTKRVMKDGDLSEKRSIFVDRDVYGNVVDRMRKPWKMLGKGQKASEEEVTRNSRARSATLRVAERLDTTTTD